MRASKYASLTLGALMLSGCGGSQEDSQSDLPPKNTTTTNPSQPLVSLAANDITSAVYANQSMTVNIKPAVRTSDGSNARLMRVSPISDDPQCTNIETSDLEFVVSATQAGSCVYEYEVSDQSGLVRATAYSQVAIAGAQTALISNNNLPTLSAAIEIGEQVTIELSPPNDMTLSSDVTTVGAGAVTQVDSENNTITYQAGSNDEDAGVSRIFYDYSDDAGNVRLGYIDIAVSTDTYNTTPVANDWLYIDSDDQLKGNAYTSVTANEPITIDLNNVLRASGEMGTLISDQDTEDTLQLVQVRAMNANVELAAPEDLENSSFTFEAYTAGRYSVSYQVSDHKGGFAIGIVDVYVGSTWPNVLLNTSKVVIKAPMSMESATFGDYDIAGSQSEEAMPSGNGYTNVPTYTWEAADAICRARGGSLPTLAHLQEFLAQEQNPFIEGDGDEFEMASNWPVERSYFSSDFSTTDANMVKVFNGKTLAVEEQSSGLDGQSETYLGYLMCVDLTPQSLNIANDGFYKEIEGTLKANFETASGAIFPYDKPLIWSVTAPEDASLRPVENIASNITYNQYSGDFLSQVSGYVNIHAQAVTEDLTVSRDIPVWHSYFDNGGADGSWIVNDDDDFGGCEIEDIPAGVDNLEFSPGYWVNAPELRNSTDILHNCSDDLVTPGNKRYWRMWINGTTASGGSDFQYRGVLRIGRTSSSEKYRFSIPETGSYRISFDTYYDGISTNPPGSGNYIVFNIFIYEPDGSFQQCFMYYNGVRKTDSDLNYSAVKAIGDGWYNNQCGFKQFPAGDGYSLSVNVFKSEENVNSRQGYIYFKNFQLIKAPQ